MVIRPARGGVGRNGLRDFPAGGGNIGVRRLAWGHAEGREGISDLADALGLRSAIAATPAGDLGRRAIYLRG